jgi:hypothetical protein
LDSIITRLSNAETVSAMGGNTYEQAREEILTALPDNFKTEVARMFAQFEISADNLDTDGKKQQLTAILNYISQNADAYEVPRSDIDGFFLPQICRILSYYDINSDKCGTEISVSTTNVPLETVTSGSSSGGGLPRWLQVVLWIIFGGIAIVGGVIVFFAVKAKLKANAEEEEGEDEEE